MYKILFALTLTDPSLSGIGRPGDWRAELCDWNAGGTGAVHTGVHLRVSVPDHADRGGQGKNHRKNDLFCKNSHKIAIKMILCFVICVQIEYH